jgi:hypothetical protein
VTRPQWPTPERLTLVALEFAADYGHQPCFKESSHSLLKDAAALYVRCSPAGKTKAREFVLEHASWLDSSVLPEGERLASLWRELLAAFDRLESRERALRDRRRQRIH